MSSSSSSAVELAAPWCFNIDARKQDQDTGTTSSIAFKHVRLFLKNRFGDPGDDVKALEESQKREGCSMATPTSEFVLRFGADDKLSLIHISEPTRQEASSYAVFCLKKKRDEKNFVFLRMMMF